MANQKGSDLEHRIVKKNSLPLNAIEEHLPAAKIAPLMPRKRQHGSNAPPIRVQTDTNTKLDEKN